MPRQGDKGRNLRRAPDWARLPCLSPERLEFRAIRRRFRAPLRTGAGQVEAVDRILIRATRADGTTGYGEVAPWPGFATESTEEALAVLRSCEGDLGRLRGHVRNQRLPCLAAALSMVEHWEAIARFEGGLPCAGLLAEGATPQAAAEKAAEGWTTLKLKVGSETPPAAARAILAAMPAPTLLRLDANGTLSLVPARGWVELARSEPRIEFVEQPLPPEHAGYVSLGPDKVALDESFVDAGPDDRWRGLVVAKPCLLGDWQAFLGWARRDPARLVVSSCFETAIGRQASLWLAAQVGSPRAVGFDTLGRFETDGRDRHGAGPVARGRSDINWEAFWAEAA